MPDPKPFRVYTVWDGPNKHEFRAQHRYQVDHGYILCEQGWMWIDWRKDWTEFNTKTIAFVPKTCIIIPGEDEHEL